MMLLWSPEALADLAGIYAFIEQENPVVAKRVLQRITGIVKTLRIMPGMGFAEGKGRRLHIPGLPYFVFYQVLDDRLEVLRVFHHARVWTPPME